MLHLLSTETLEIVYNDLTKTFNDTFNITLRQQIVEQANRIEAIYKIRTGKNLYQTLANK